MRAWAGSWGSASSIALSSEFLSNPYMLPSRAESAEGVGLQLTLPASYVGDTDTFDFTPRLRFAHSWRTASLLSNYQYLDVSWRAVRERSSLQLNAGWHHDSTQYNAFETDLLHGYVLRRSEATASTDMQRALTERSALHLSLSWDAVSYSYGPNNGVVPYHYGQAALQYDHDITERMHWTSALGIGLYTLPGSESDYRSENRFAQLGLSGQLTETWALNVLAGGSNVQTREEALFGPLTISKDAPNLTFDVQHHGERTTLAISATRAIQPSGLGELVLQDDGFIKDTLNLTERWTLSAQLRGERLRDSLKTLSVEQLRNYGLDLNANWQWTEAWNANLQVSLSRRADIQPSVEASGVGIFLSAVRQFGRKQLN